MKREELALVAPERIDGQRVREAVVTAKRMSTCRSTGTGAYWPCLSEAPSCGAARELLLRRLVEIRPELREGRELAVLGGPRGRQLAREFSWRRVCAARRRRHEMRVQRPDLQARQYRELAAFAQFGRISTRRRSSSSRAARMTELLKQASTRPCRRAAGAHPLSP